ncbi:Proton-dependent oligopeptide transporter [Trema orientale]|uniref:Proton-dependent oligopeptide transporter n=1 Tax=Trema orientale TaxID=63057 RepID=A0A2P5CTF0_TREOI|nr:Proton-dependent oligopeptide transporter [Trema orientale]
MEPSEQNTSTTSPGNQVLEAQDDINNSKRGGWITFPFIMGNLGGLSVASGGWVANWIVFLITKYNIGSITATKINNVGFGLICLFPVAGAIIADSCTGNFAVVSISSFIALLGMTLLTLMAGIPSLRPPPCSTSSSTMPCESPTMLQYLFLYATMVLITMGLGGSRFTISTLGADQFDKANHQASFFSWYFIILYVGNAFSFIVLVYLEDNVGWGLGFGICLATTAVGCAMFLLGKRFYRLVKPTGSPFVSIARVVVAAIRKRKVSLTESRLTESSDYYYYGITTKMVQIKSPSASFRFLNRASFKTENDKQVDGVYAKSWKLFTVEEVEDLKNLIKLIPLWSTGILLTTSIATFNSLSTVQALAMDRRVGSIKIPAGTFLAFTLVTTAISIFFVDRYLLDMWRKLSGRSVTTLQKIAIGHAFNVVGLVGIALTEARRLHLARINGLVTAPQSNSVVPMSALWLVPSLVLVGIGEAFHFPGQVALYYQEFPESLKSTSTAMVSLLIGLGYTLSAVSTDFIGRTTAWLPDNINEGRVDNVYWLFTGIGVVNLGYLLVCARLYKYQHGQNTDHDDVQPTQIHL